MGVCPNCGEKITSTDQVCPNCGFNLAKYRETFFADNEKPKVQSRAQYREEFKPKKQNSVVQKMIAWVRANATIVFLLGVVLLIIMSFSRPLGWISFLVLMVLLFIVCDRKEKIEQYTADVRLTQKINQVGSDMFNTVEKHSEKAKQREKKFEEDHPKVAQHVEKVKNEKAHHISYVPISIILMAVINLIVLFTGSGASISNISYTGHLSIAKVAFGLANRSLTNQNWVVAGILYLVLILLIVFPIYIIYNTLKNTKKSKFLAFLLALVETAFLVFSVFRLSEPVTSSSGILGQVTSQLLTYAVSIGASAYFLILVSVILSILCGYNLFRKSQAE